ncbi:putative sensor protein [Yersinia pekkanenii]|uniref:diguanylate cyclase n=1 Tax=Yersinia pekkanenii TaxID=1288385 RepID=A0A0T9NEC1_9GAMM|nr:PAS domain S-box protein [Yersinia pekkanenii]CNH02456.1 putative sensor protein [Yersinia pekkanenii]CRY63971.1 putative sensor protein [Yersinia pekkanenii]
MDLSAAEKPAPDNKTILHITIISIVVFLLALFCIQLSEQSENLAPLWFPTAVLMIALFHHPLRYWPWQLLTAGICIVAANFILYGISWFPLPLTLINLAEAAVGAWLLRKFLQPKDPLNSLFSWLKFSICTVVIVPLVSGLAAAWYLSPQNDNFSQVFTIWFMSEAIGMLALGPVGLLYRRGYFNIATQSNALFDMMWMTVLSLAACYIGLLYLPFPFTFVIMALIWTSIRLPRFETFTVCFLATVLIAMMINFNLFTLQADTKLSVQAFSFIPLLMVLIPPHAMSMVMHAFRMEKANIVESENRFRNAMEYSAIGMALVSPEGKWMQVNKALCKLLGYSQETLLTLTFQQITHPEDLSADLKLLDDLYHGRIPSYSMEKRYIRSDGEVVWALLVVSVVRDHELQPLYFISQVEDINELKKTEMINRRLTEALHEEKERLHITLDSIGEAVVCTDQEMKITFMNPVAEKMTGWANTSALGQPVNQIIKLTNGVDGPEIDNPIEHCLNHRAYSSLNESMVLHHRDGRYYDIQESVAPLKTLEGDIVGAVLVFQDAGESRAMMRKLSHSASHDNLTGLPNRANFDNRLKAAIQISVDLNQQNALAFLDLDYFKAINDTAGHPAGDALLKEIGQLMHQHLRNSDCIARLGGDEFGLLMLNCTLPDAKAITQSLVSMINGYHFHWEDKLYRIGASAGVTRISSSNNQRSEIMAQADIACYTAKRSGRGQVRLYQSQQKQLPVLLPRSR